MMVNLSNCFSFYAWSGFRRVAMHCQEFRPAHKTGRPIYSLAGEYRLLWCTIIALIATTEEPKKRGRTAVFLVEKC